MSAAAITMGSAFEPLVAGAANAVAGVAGAFNALPDAAQGAVATFGAVASATSLMLGSLAVAIPRIIAFRNGLASLRASGTVFGMLAGSMGPVALGLGALAVAGSMAWASFREGREAVERMEDALIQLGDVATNLRLGYRDMEAGLVDAFTADVQSVEELAIAYIKLNETQDEWQGRYPELINAYSRLPEELTAVSNAVTAIGNAYADQRIDAEALYAAQRELYNQYIGGAITLDQYDAGLIDISQNLERYRVEAEQTTTTTLALAAATGALTSGLNTMGSSVADIGGGIASLIPDTANASIEEYNAFIERQAELLERLIDVGGLSDPLSQWNLAGNASDAAVLANNLTDAAAAAESVFRVIVGNTNAIKSQADATLDWATGLINVRGELGRIDELVNQGLITGTSGVFDDGSQYAQAQDAFDSIADSVGRINDNLDAVQAIQAPLMAEMTASTAAYTEELLAMEPAQQVIALGAGDGAEHACRRSRGW
jgi:hypothetical protein